MTTMRLLWKSSNGQSSHGVNLLDIPQAYRIIDNYPLGVWNDFCQLLSLLKISLNMASWSTMWNARLLDIRVRDWEAQKCLPMIESASLI